MKTALEVDRALVEVGEAIDLLLHVSPVNAEEAWLEFSESGFEVPPSFHYRPLGFDADACRSRLVALSVEDVEDPTLGFLLDEKRVELDRRLTLLTDRETDRFLHGSLALFGDVDDALMSDAEKVLADVQPQVVRDLIEPEEFCELARAELDHYNSGADDLGLEVELRDDVPGMMVARGKLFVSSGLKIARARADALVQHEVGTHLLTAANGRMQPFGLFAIGLPGYEQTQEGLAIFAEYMSGGLDRARLRLLGARVVAVRRLLDGAGFRDVFSELHRDRGFRPKSAWSVTMRVFRSGGLTKDAIYLRGLTEIMNHVRSGGALEPLLVGKVGLAHIPLVDDLLAREVLMPPRFWPRWLKVEGASERMGRIRAGLDLSELVNESL